MCSSSRGPAMSPSLVTWPTMNAGTPETFAQRIRSIVHWRSWATLPGACEAASEYTVWIESTMSSAGESDSAVRPRDQRGDLQQQRGLADAGVAADQRQRAGDDAPAQHAVELGKA